MSFKYRCSGLQIPVEDDVYHEFTKCSRKLEEPGLVSQRYCHKNAAQLLQHTFHGMKRSAAREVLTNK